MGTPAQRPAGTRGGPTRVHSAKAAKVTAMVSGYSSTVSHATALRIVYAVWAIAGLGMLATGLFGITAAGLDQSEDFSRLVQAVQGGVGLLQFVTVLAWFAWVVPTWNNVSKLGRRAKVGFRQIAMRHLMGIPIAFVAAVVGVVSPSLRRTALLVILISMAYVSILIPVMIYQTKQMLWETGSLPGRGPEALPHIAVVWIASWIGLNLAQGMVEGGTTSTLIAGYGMLVAGICSIVSSTLAGQLVTAISVRQDARMQVIIDDVQGDPGGSKSAEENVQSEWAKSADLVKFNH